MERTVAAQDLAGLLARVRELHAARRGLRGSSAGSDAGLAELRDAASELYRAIQSACRDGDAVVIHSQAGSHHSHTIRTTGGLFGEVVLRYSPARDAAACSYHCILTEADRIEILPYAAD